MMRDEADRVSFVNGYTFNKYIYLYLVGLMLASMDFDYQFSDLGKDRLKVF